MEQKRKTSQHVITNRLDVKNKERILKTAMEREQVTKTELLG